MNKVTIVIFFLCLFTFPISAQKQSYQFFNSDGQKISYYQMLSKVKTADVVFFGENHDDPISHWLQLELTKDLFKEHANNLILGAEMLESDDQIKLNEYLLGFIREKDFEREVKIWKNHKTDYRPLIHFAKKNNLKFIATNIPRRFASIVYRFGLDTLNYLPETSKQFIAPLPIIYDTSLYCYKAMSNMIEGHNVNNLGESQAIKDATMAYFINLHIKENSKFLHYNGAYHSKFHESIVWYLMQLNKEIKIVTISAHRQQQLSQLDSKEKGVADFIIVVDEDMTRTY